ncbi:MAG: non-ribosomal peptide synthetase [Proteobacteria bacterium]|nr:non-ribosomal peptide synthetase [Pseudomonadota bacterium]
MTAQAGQVKSSVSGSAGAAPALACLAPGFAVCGGALRLDSAALSERRERMAAALAAAGVGPGGIVALAAARTSDSFAAILAILHLGAACLPLDPAYPRERLAQMLDDAHPDVLVGTRAQLDVFAAADSARLPLETALACTLATPSAAPENDDALAYVLFTSGSTGRPKGVAMRRGPIARLVHWHAKHPRLARAARTLQFAPLGFDVAFQELLVTAATGGTLVLPDDMQRRDPFALLDLLVDARIERIFLPYVALQAMAEAVAAGGAVPNSLRDVITAGEQLRITPAIRALFTTLPDCVLHNHYGPTETHVVTSYELDGDPQNWPELPPIGHPLPYVRVCVADAGLHEVRLGDEGELLLGGDCLAAGYLRRPELTAERFIERDGARWYRSGDAVRDMGDGVLDWLGRLDEQIKLDGYRIEPAEIEMALLTHPAIAQAAVVATNDGVGRRLVAHVVARHAQGIDADALRAHCRARLAPYMVPQALVEHAALPLTPSGKIDRRTLARHVDVAPLAWPQDATLEAQLATLWKQLLGVDTLDVHANLFDLGARSLSVVQALTELHRHGYRQLTAVAIYEYPSVAALAAHVDSVGAAVPASDAVHARGERQRTALSRFAPKTGAAR